VIVTAILRTVIPALWGSFIGWVLSVLPVLEPLREDLLAVAENPVIVPFIITFLIGLWYVIWAKLQPHIPDWLVRLVLGSAKRPVYVEPKAILKADGTPDMPGPDHRARG
jgi:hypothetical protein